MNIEAEISRAAAGIAQDLSLAERIKLAQAINGITSLDEIPQIYREQISAVIQKKQVNQ